MAHIDPERLTLIAFGEQMSAQETEHFEHCQTCTDGLAEVKAIIGVGRDAGQVRDLPAVPDDVWQRISQEVRSGTGRQRRHRNGWRSAVLAVAAVLIGVAGTLGVQALGDKPQKIVAEARLDSKNVATRSVRGTVTIVDTGHGLQMKVDVSGMPSTTGYYAVWLFDGADTMIPLGTLGPAPLNLPDSARDLGRFPLVDISAQKLGQQAHGVSMLQGELRAE